MQSRMYEVLSIKDRLVNLLEEPKRMKKRIADILFTKDRDEREILENEQK